MAATDGIMYTDEGELEFDEDEMAGLEGLRLVAEFTRCTKWPGQPSIIDPVTNAANVKKGLCASNPNPNNHLLSLSTNCSTAAGP